MVSGRSNIKEGKKEALKRLIRSLHEGANPEEVKTRFREILGSVTPTEIAEVEEELVKEGMPREEIRRLCDVHLEVFKETLEKERVLAPQGHPVHILTSRFEPEGVISFETGTLSKKELEAVLNALPVDITFVDKEDTVRYFSLNQDRIFVRTKAVIGRKVQQCHPQKSVHMVNKILEAFKSGSRDVAEFWINVKDKLVYIRYMAVRDENGNYLGCLEVAQDITNIKKMEGEKRLLDWT